MRGIWLRLAALGLVVASACKAPAESVGPPTEPSSSASTDAELGPKERLERKLAARRGEAGSATVELELEQLASGHIVVPLQIGDHEPLTFILDTGASTSVISRETQALLGFRDEDGTPVKGQGANGELSDVRLFSLPDARVGVRAYKDVNVAVMDLAHLEEKLQARIGGILGRNFLQRHALEVDFSRRKLRLHPAGSVESGAVDVGGMVATEFGRFKGGLIRIEVRVDDGEPFPGVLDLGAARSVMNWHAARAQGLTPESKGLDQSSEPLLGADNTPIETRAYTFRDISVGEAKIPDPRLYIADLGVFRTLGIANGPAMVFGLDMLHNRSLVIDYARRQVFISREAT